MLLDFNKLPTQVWKKFKGGEKEVVVRMFKDSMNRIMFMKLEPGASIGYHKHENNCEIVYVLQGTATATYDGVEEIIESGMCGYCPMGHEHCIENKGDEDLVFFSVVSSIEPEQPAAE